MALFEDGSMDKILFLISRIGKKVDIYNDLNPNCRIEYLYGIGFDEGEEVKTITDLISLANRRIYDKNPDKNQPVNDD